MMHLEKIVTVIILLQVLMPLFKFAIINEEILNLIKTMVISEKLKVVLAICRPLMFLAIGRP